MASALNVVTPAAPIVTPVPTFNSPPEILTPDLAVIRPTESTLVTSSYVRTPVNVAATPVILLTVISGVPVNPPAVPEVFWFNVATLAAATVPEAILAVSYTHLTLPTICSV